jgi:hypothetical protein
MKISTLRLSLSLFTLLIVSFSPSKACNLSDLTFCGIDQSPTPLLNPAFPNDSLICLTVCNGYGVTGVSQGADSDTRSIGFGWYDVNPGFVIRAFSPSSITSGRGFDDCTMLGADIGAQGAPYNSQATVLFVDPGYYGSEPCASQPFGCISTTVECGNEAQQCVTYIFQVSQIPDSVRVFGVEGAGNPLDGCYPDADMMHAFGGLSLEWGSLEGIALKNTIKVKWTTLTEINTDVFILERANAQGIFEEIGTLKGSGNSASVRRYEMVDLAPMIGNNRYRIVQIDDEGGSAISTIVEVMFNGPTTLSWGAIAPNPASAFVNLTFFHDQSEDLLLTLCTLDGKVIVKEDLRASAGTNQLQMILSEVKSGSYIISLQGAKAKVSRRLLKL